MSNESQIACESQIDSVENRPKTIRFDPIRFAIRRVCQIGSESIRPNRDPERFATQEKFFRGPVFSTNESTNLFHEIGVDHPNESRSGPGLVSLIGIF